MAERVLIFDTPNSPEIEIHVPPGHILIFKRRVRIERNFETGEEVRSWRYILGSEPMGQENEAVSPMVTPRTG